LQEFSTVPAAYVTRFYVCCFLFISSRVVYGDIKIISEK